MKIQIRRNVFETNSSSVHSCSICTLDIYDKFKAGEVWYKSRGYNEDDSYLPVDKAIEFNIKYIKENYPSMTDEEFSEFCTVYKREKNFYSAFDAIDFAFNKWDIDSSDVYLSEVDWWECHEYEDWEQYFKDTAGVDMVAWGYCGSDY